MRRVVSLPVLAILALSVSACSNDTDTGYLGSRDDIIVNNRNMPSEAQTRAAVKEKIETVQMDAAKAEEMKQEDIQKAAMEKAIEEAKKEVPPPPAKMDAADMTKEQVVQEAKAAMAKEADGMPQKMAAASAPTPAPVQVPPTQATPPKPAIQPMGTTEMAVPPELRKPEPVPAPAPAPVEPEPLADNSGDIPLNAKPGECYAKVLIPAITDSKTERVKISDEQEVLARIVPPKFKTETEKVLVKEARKYWKKGEGPIQKVDQATGQILCLVEEPAVYKTVEKQVMVEPERPEYKKIPAQYETITKTVIVKPERMEWRRILCQTNVTPTTIMRLQKALQGKGLDVGKIDGKLGSKTMSALSKYQSKHGLARGITYETLDHLGVAPAGA